MQEFVSIYYLGMMLRRSQMIFCPPRRSKGKIKGLTLRMDYGPLTASEMLYETFNKDIML